ncbi:MAG: hypothetical protein AABW79_04330 [Nanoarchaeota archaeon]
MENKDGYTPDEVAEMIFSYVNMTRAISAAGNMQNDPTVYAILLGTTSEKTLFSLREKLFGVLKERLPQNVFSSLRPELRELSDLV